MIGVLIVVKNRFFRFFLFGFLFLGNSYSLQAALTEFQKLYLETFDGVPEAEFRQKFWTAVFENDSVAVDALITEIEISRSKAPSQHKDAARRSYQKGLIYASTFYPSGSLVTSIMDLLKRGDGARWKKMGLFTPLNPWKVEAQPDNVTKKISKFMKLYDDNMAEWPFWILMNVPPDVDVLHFSLGVKIKSDFSLIQQYAVSSKSQVLLVATNLACKYFKRVEVESKIREFFRNNSELQMDEEFLSRVLSQIYLPGSLFEKFSDRLQKQEWEGAASDIVRLQLPADKNQLSVDPSAYEYFSGRYQVTVFTDSHDLTYSVCEPGGGSYQAVVIDVYSGYSADFRPNSLPAAKCLPNSNIVSISLQLWDKESTILQSEQLDNPKNARDTHFSYLYATSLFVNHMKKFYPNAKILLSGGSFGGFFVSSYLLFQSMDPDIVDASFYHPEMKSAFKSVFKDEKITPVAGIISQSGSIYRLQKITGKLEESIFVAPAAFIFNFDDDRVTMERVKPFIEKLNMTNAANEFWNQIEFYFNRVAAAGGFSDIGETDKLATTTTRGHFHLSKNDDTMVRFVNRLIDKRGLTPLDKKLQTRRKNLYVSQLDEVYKKIGITKKNIQRFLSNQISIQYEYETEALTKSNSKSKKEINERALEHIDLPYFLTAIDLYLEGNAPLFVHNQLFAPMFCSVLGDLQQKKLKEERQTVVDQLLHSDSKGENFYIRSLLLDKLEAYEKSAPAKCKLQKGKEPAESFSVLFGLLVEQLFDLIQSDKSIANYKDEIDKFQHEPSYRGNLENNFEISYRFFIKLTSTKELWSTAIQGVKERVHTIHALSPSPSVPKPSLASASASKVEQVAVVNAPPDLLKPKPPAPLPEGVKWVSLNKGATSSLGDGVLYVNFREDNFKIKTISKNLLEVCEDEEEMAGFIVLDIFNKSHYFQNLNSFAEFIQARPFGEYQREIPDSLMFASQVGCKPKAK